ncbi:Ubiquitin carboxyl-terminal hydrolases family 2 [Ostreococcus tauri]|uniref:ubiquitinyl hydrolase 1 n=1 Tax=Ostreococcus tauri TaxID=70448 RepID=Q00YT7_OSTTA|nr:Ubiquitin carboxyl-terminal hydrolases family 2 [Ostreococcus tauri]CAL55822.1 Ubiquitin carboxyl-terminal hydrolases family 2 [Ostreococcus tauri]|eukprot:XP_003082019.1 Ubiquitin carboxyl-terminal hydrolases family 2 [Ostreococcus tauri]
MASILGSWFGVGDDVESDSESGGSGAGSESDGATTPRARRDAEEAEQRALLPPATTLHSYEDVRRAVNGNRSEEDYPSGLTNGGNTCFAAAALQCLRRATPLTAWFDDVDTFHDAKRCAETRRFCVVCEYARHLERARESRDAHSIGRLTKDISKVAKQFRRGRQEDSHEFITALLDAMHVMFLKDLGGEKKFDLRTQETTVIYHVFGGYTLGTVKCLECGYVSKSFQSTLDIPLEVTGKITSIEEALRENFCSEELLQGSNKYKCSKCKALVRAKKGTKIHVSPNILTIPLKRYSTGRFSKITKYVTYPATFSLVEFMSDDAPYEESAPEYELFGVLVHQDFYASAHAGHYVAYVKLRDDSWVLCNDNRISPSSEKEAMKQKAYILFYERSRARGAPPIRPPGYLEELKLARDAERGAPATRQDDELAAREQMLDQSTSSTAERLVSKLDSMTLSESAQGAVSSPRATLTPSASIRRVVRPDVPTSGQPTYIMETVRTEKGRELRVSVTLPGCVTAREFEVELTTRTKSSPSCLVIKAPTLYTDPLEISLPDNVDDPTKSSFIKNSSKLNVRFPIHEGN